MLDPKRLSQLCTNSFFHSAQGMKPGRLDGMQRSLQEASAGKTKKGTSSEGRIVLGLDDENNLIILDGRHLMHVFLLLKKNIPLPTIVFDSSET